METGKPFKYYAFISYKREDEEWAIWLQHELEYYHLPALLNGREDLPKVFHPVFRDIDELKAGNLPSQIYEALASSLHLIVICSPRSAKSEWVNKEIETFIEIGKEKGFNNLEHVFPFIVEGKPHDKAQECFPKALRDLPADKERIGGNVNESGGNVNESGRDKAFIKVMAGMLPNVSMDMLWNRYERDKAEEERRKREERNKLMVSQSRFVSEKANKLIEEGDSYTARRLLMAVMPTSLAELDKPYTVESERTLRNACLNDSAILNNHSNSVNSVEFSPDGKYLITASDDKTVKLFDIASGTELYSFEGHDLEIQHAAFSPDGAYFVSASCDHNLKVWDIETNTEIQHFKGHSNEVWCAVFSPDGKHIASASHDHTIKIWNIKQGKILHTLYGHADAVNSATFSPNGKLIVSASWDKTVRIWDAETAAQLHNLKGHTEKVLYAVFSPDGKRIASASADHSIRIWDAETGEEIRVLTEHGSIVNYVAFSHDGTRLVSASDDNTLKIWRAETGDLMLTLYGHADGVLSANFSPDGKQIASASYDQTVRIWDINPMAENKSIDGQDKITNPASFLTDGKHIFFASKDNTLDIWNISLTQKLFSLEGPSIFTSAAFSPDEKRIITVCNDNTIRIWDATTRAELRVIKKQHSGINSAVFSHDGKYLAVATDLDESIIILDTEHYEDKLLLKGHTFWVTHASFSPDGARIVSSSHDDSIIIWDAKTGTKIISLKGQKNPMSVEYSHDGRYIVSASFEKTITIWDAETGIDLLTLKGHTDVVNSAAFTPDDKHIISTSADGTIRIWPFPPLQELIDQTRERFKDRPLTPEERRMYYLE